MDNKPIITPPSPINNGQTPQKKSMFSLPSWFKLPDMFGKKSSNPTSLAPTPTATITPQKTNGGRRKSKRTKKVKKTKTIKSHK